MSILFLSQSCVWFRWVLQLDQEGTIYYSTTPRWISSPKITSESLLWFRLLVRVHLLQRYKLHYYHTLVWYCLKVIWNIKYIIVNHRISCEYLQFLLLIVNILESSLMMLHWFYPRSCWLVWPLETMCLVCSRQWYFHTQRGRNSFTCYSYWN